MKKVSLMLGILVASSLAAWADEHSHMQPEGASVLQGEVIDLMCYVGHDAMGKKHADCAQSCIKKGGPAAILSSDGKLYVATIAEHGSVADTLGKLGGQKVKVTGKIASKGGSNFVEIAKVEKL